MKIPGAGGFDRKNLISERWLSCSRGRVFGSAQQIGDLTLDFSFELLMRYTLEKNHRIIAGGRNQE